MKKTGKYRGVTIESILKKNGLRPADREAAREIGTFVYHSYRNSDKFIPFKKVYEDGHMVNNYPIKAVKTIVGLTMSFVNRKPQLVKRMRRRIKKANPVTDWPHESK
jgi:hypothetical protein